MSALQDQDFVIGDANLGTGLVTGHKNVDVSKKGSVFANTFARALTGVRFSANKRSQIEASITVRKMANVERIRVRANFEMKLYGDDGSMKTSLPVIDGEFYQEFFAKLSKAVFLDAIYYVEEEESS